MAESTMFGQTTSSPLFDKMDALMRKHRVGVDSSQEIPVLTEEALEPEFDLEPALIQAKGPAGAGLMFDLREFSSYSPSPAPASAVASHPAESVAPRHFIDLPLLDLDQIARTRGEHDPLDLAVDELRPEAVRWPAEWSRSSVAPVEHEPVMPAEAALAPAAFEVEEIDFSSSSSQTSEDWENMAIPTLDCVVDMAVQPVAEVEPQLQIPSCDFMPEPVTVISIDEDEFAASHIEIELPAPAARAEPASFEESLTLSELPSEPEAQILSLDTASRRVVPPLPAVAEPAHSSPRLDETAVAEITAAVAAQISVEVSTEVAQLARQHFSGMMTTFYSESLRKITEEISRDMEMCLAPRIAELVEGELRRQGLVG